jgi:hypothetical protein
MKTRILGLAMAVLAVFGSTALAASSVGGAGCCPFCR